MTLPKLKLQNGGIGKGLLQRLNQLEVHNGQLEYRYNRSKRCVNEGKSTLL